MKLYATLFFGVLVLGGCNNGSKDSRSVSSGSSGKVALDGEVASADMISADPGNVTQSNDLSAPLGIEEYSEPDYGPYWKNNDCKQKCSYDFEAKLLKNCNVKFYLNKDEPNFEGTTQCWKEFNNLWDCEKRYNYPQTQAEVKRLCPAEFDAKDACVGKLKQCVDDTGYTGCINACDKNFPYTVKPPVKT